MAKRMAGICRIRWQSSTACAILIRFVESRKLLRGRKFAGSRPVEGNREEWRKRDESYR